MCKDFLLSAFKGRLRCVFNSQHHRLLWGFEKVPGLLETLLLKTCYRIKIKKLCCVSSFTMTRIIYVPDAHALTWCNGSHKPFYFPAFEYAPTCISINQGRKAENCSVKEQVKNSGYKNDCLMDFLKSSYALLPLSATNDTPIFQTPIPCHFYIQSLRLTVITAPVQCPCVTHLLLNVIIFYATKTLHSFSSTAAFFFGSGATAPEPALAKAI